MAGGQGVPWHPNFFEIVGFSEIFLLRRKIFRILLLVKIFIGKLLNLPPPLLYRYDDTPASSDLHFHFKMREDRCINLKFFDE